ncbi:hypothetical protein [Halodesulfovibrio marinisediminis]|uniref:Pentapeptide MXKDX repeat protein n=1 Tax=Halodesulfovibrio marinisediminis DSM 17456 TaxID=1121457 RepID=A0A1N6ECW0_9BACT|nr:hypothetical protein [Halodesulfovibrio marinisediminis]SIN80811.1 hypothetical protein SAMN02745161_0895 [Halodesulfovibrio marinisediminis DSM 17456]
MNKNVIAIITIGLLVLTGAVAFATDTMVKGDGYTLASSHEGHQMKHDHDQMMKKGGDMKHDHDQMMKKDGDMKHDHDQMMRKGDDMKQMDKEHEGHDHGTKKKQ